MPRLICCPMAYPMDSMTVLLYIPNIKHAFTGIKYMAQEKYIDQLDQLKHLKITAINNKKVHNQVYDQLKRLLLQGTWKSGEKIPSENQLTKIFEVSRISVRSAIKSLIAQGFLEARQGEGTFVIDASIEQNLNLLIPMMNYSRESILEVLQFRRIIEVGMMPVVIENLRQVHLDAILKSIEDLEQMADSCTKEIIALDLEFHRMLCTIAKNRLVLKVNEILNELYRHSMTRVVENIGSRLGRVYHRKIYETLLNRDADAAKAIMEEHIIKTIEHVKSAPEELFNH